MAAKKKRKTEYDWGRYNRDLVDRGRRLAKGIGGMRSSVVANWEAELEEMNSGKEGARFVYPDSQIVFMAVIRSAFRVSSLRMPGGMGGLFFEEVPDYSRISRRIRKLPLDTLRSIDDEATRAGTKGRVVEIAMDGTGVQVNGKYVWVDKKGGKLRRRKWAKVSIAVDLGTRQIVGIRVLGQDANEGSHGNTAALVKDVYDGLGEGSRVNSAYGDGGFDNEGNFGMFGDIGVEPVIRVRRQTVERAKRMSRSISGRKREKFFSVRRNREALAQSDWKGYVAGKGYGKRGGIEGGIGSFKRMFGERTFSRLRAMVNREMLVRAIVWNMAV